MGIMRDDGVIEDHCLEKLKPGEKFFVLRAQDLSADVAVDFWVYANNFLKRRIREGVPYMSAVSELRAKLRLSFPLPTLDLENEKYREAWDCAEQMRQWPTRKLAD